MAQIIINNINSVIEGLTIPSKRAVIEELAVDTPGCEFTSMYKSGKWDGKTHFFNKTKNEFPTGLLSRVVSAIKSVNETVNIIDNRKGSRIDIPDTITLHDDNIGNITLRDYQYESVKNALTATRGIVNVATNGGKCLTQDTRILTDKGYKTIEQIFQELGHPCEVSENVIQATVPLINRFGKIEEASHITFNGIKPIKVVKTKSGLEQKVTFNHPLLTVTTEGDFVWKKSEDMAVGDLLVTRIGDNIYGDDTTITNEEEAYSIGVIIADGYINNYSKISVTNNQESIRKIVERYFNTLGAKRVYKESSEGSTTIAMSGVNAVTKWHDHLGIGFVVDKDKRVPQCIINSPKNIQLAFLSGYMECECNIDTSRPRIEVSSVSRGLLSDVQLLLKNMGVNSSVSEKKSKVYPDNDYSRLTIGSQHSCDLLKMLTFKTVQRKEQTTRGINNFESKAHRYVNDISNMYFDPVEEVSCGGYATTFDVHMPETHSFIAESIVNHNTEIACGIIKTVLPYIPDGKRVLFFTHSKEIYSQTVKRLHHRLQIPIGEIGAGKWNVEQVTVVMIPTISKYLTKKNSKPTTKAYKEILARKEEIETLYHIATNPDIKNQYVEQMGDINRQKAECEKEHSEKINGNVLKAKEVLSSAYMFIGDEVHHASSDTWYKVFMSMKDTHFRFGLTGTVDESNPVNVMKLHGCTGRIVSKVSNQFLIDNGYSAKPTIYLLKVPAMNIMDFAYSDARRFGIIECVERNEVFVNKVVERAKSGKQCLIIVNETEHGEIILPMIEEEGISVRFSHGQKTDKYRDESLSMLREGTLQVLIATSILDEGVDVSGINCIFLMAGGKSMRQLLQRIGRGLRKKEDGSGVEVYDSLDYHNRYLTKHLMERYNTYKSEGFEIYKL